MSGLLSPRPALWWRREGRAVRCLLCPHLCLLEEEERGFCGVRLHKTGGGLVSLNDEVLLAMAVDAVEKKPLYHWRPGTRILSLGTGGCNLACPFCQNHALSQWSGLPPGEPFAVKSIADELRRRNLDAVAFTYNEPLIWYEFVLEACREMRAQQVATVLVTNGQILPGPRDLLIPHVNAANVDVKAFSEEVYGRLGGELRSTLRFVEALRENNIHVEVTHLVVPGLTDDEAAFRKLVHWLASLDDSIPLHLSRYFPRHLWREPPTSPERLRNLGAIAAESLRRVYLGNLPGESRTICLHCGHDIVVRREYDVVAMELDASGKCLHCGTPSDIRLR
ncbi:AmmeMemoRadiSam system radical SAM enzyme [Aminithiophilus ramosus]|uniref:AmmeMemoRadiSam system radical SAM enzyme n=2 Tax=Synergistales TaxID=649776 RepID=A0A9Q7AFC3_9BACT|nr:AmmeMemoRadiSam system radical SAM enzyme [Aminithiophilus ramosus]QTX33573.1 AmmeMemoRadiSam system radical SAM enzyme [Aminithiophilus ramosus]QVL37427.1 AmmeMemoRadiSam system radical SAM enzyme [Synergistota bacterium]